MPQLGEKSQLQTPRIPAQFHCTEKRWPWGRSRL